MTYKDPFQHQPFCDSMTIKHGLWTTEGLEALAQLLHGDGEQVFQVDPAFNQTLLGTADPKAQQMSQAARKLQELF